MLDRSGLRENLELVQEFGLPLGQDSLEKAEFILGLRYDAELGGFWSRYILEGFESIFNELDEAMLEVRVKIEKHDYILNFQDIEDLIYVKADKGAISREILKRMIRKMRKEVGNLGRALSDEVWAELMAKFEFTITEEVEKKRDVLLRYSRILDAKSELGAYFNDCLESDFPDLKKEMDLYVEYLFLARRYKMVSDDYRSKFSVVGVSESYVSRLIEEVNAEIDNLIDASDSSDDTEIVESDSVSSTSEEVLLDDGYKEEYVNLALSKLMHHFEKFLGSPSYTRSLLKMFGDFRFNVETEFLDEEARGLIIKLFLEKLVVIGEKRGWNEKANISFKEALVGSFEGYEVSFGYVIDLLNELKFELEEEVVYHPSSIRIPDNIRIDFKHWRNVVKHMGGEINNNGHGKHSEFVVPFDNFSWTYSLPNNFFQGRHERYARVFMNELTEFMTRQGIESLTKNDFERLQAAYDSIGIRIEFRP